MLLTNPLAPPPVPENIRAPPTRLLTLLLLTNPPHTPHRYRPLAPRPARGRQLLSSVLVPGSTEAGERPPSSSLAVKEAALFTRLSSIGSASGYTLPCTSVLAVSCLKGASSTDRCLDLGHEHTQVAPPRPPHSVGRPLPTVRPWSASWTTRRSESRPVMTGATGCSG